DSDAEANRVLTLFAEGGENEYNRLLPDQHEIHYYGAIRATKACIGCHQKLDPDVREGSLIAAVKIRMATDDMESAVHLNRAWLISTALVTVLLIMAGSWLIVRYVIV